jgi:ribosomal protein L35
MPKMKTRKSVKKRVKTTRTGKVLILSQGINHFNGKMSGNTRRAKRGKKTLGVNFSDVQKALPKS